LRIARITASSLLVPKIGVVAAERAEVLVVAVVQRVEAFLEEVKFQLRRHHGVKAHRLGAGDLALQDRAGADGDLLMRVMVEKVGHAERRARKPGDAAQRGEVRLHHIVAVALFPAGRLVARNREHLDVDGEEVVAAMRLLPPAVHEVLGNEAFAHEAALHVHDGHEDGVDLASGDGLLQRVEGQVCGHFASPRSSFRARIRAPPCRSGI
jgi:hypothetical protein